MNPVRDFADWDGGWDGGKYISNRVNKCHGFSTLERLKKNYEFKRAREKGTSYKDGVFILNIYKNDIGRHRLGASISFSKFPLASERNRLKRLVREIFRIHKQELKGGTYDLVFAIRGVPDYKLDYSTIEEKFLALLRKAKAL